MWNSSFQTFLKSASHTLLEDRRKRRDDTTTELKLLTREPFPEWEVFKAEPQTGRKSAPCWELASLPSPTTDAATVHCSLFPSPRERQHTQNKNSHLRNSRGRGGAEEHGERTQSLQLLLNKQQEDISALFVQSLLLGLLCKQSQLAGTSWPAPSSPPQPSCLIHHACDVSVPSQWKATWEDYFPITSCGRDLKGWNEMRTDNPLLAARRGNLQCYGNKFSRYKERADGNC